MLDFRPFELHQDDGLFGPQEIRHHADDFEVELFDLVAGKDGVSVALHARTHLINRKCLIQRGLRLRETRAGEKDCCQGELDGAKQHR